MYEDNRNEGFDGNGSPDNHRAEETTPNFVMKDTPSSEPSQPRDGYGQQPYSPMNQNSQQGAYGGNPGQMDNRQPFGGYQNQQNYSGKINNEGQDQTKYEARRRHRLPSRRRRQCPAHHPRFRQWATRWPWMFLP